MWVTETVDGKVCTLWVENLVANISEPFLPFDIMRQHKIILFRAVLCDSSERINFTVCIPLLCTRGCLIEILWTPYERTNKGCRWPNFTYSHCRSTFRNQQISSVIYENPSITGSFTRGSTVGGSTTFYCIIISSGTTSFHCCHKRFV